MNLKKLNVIVLLSIVLVLAPTLKIAFAQSEPDPFYISAGIYPSAPFYTVWQEGTYYFAKNAYGLIVYSGQNASLVINNALSDAGGWTNKGTVLLEEGDYTLSSTLQVKEYTSLIGSGMEKTMLYLSSGANDNVIENYQTGPEWFFHFADFTIYGNKDGQSSGHGIYLVNARDITIERVRTQYCKQDGMHFQDGFLHQIYYSFSDHNDGYGIYANNTETALKIRNCVVENSGLDNIRVLAGSSHEIANNQIEGGYNGIFFTGYYSSIENNYVCDSSHYNIYVGSYRNEILNNRIRLSNNISILLESAHHSKVSGNIISNTLPGRSGSYGISLSSGSHYSAITGNVIENVTGGIFLFDSDHNTLTGNVITDDSDAGICFVNSDWNVVTTNRVVDATGWGILELETSDYNVIVGSSASASTGGIQVIGANTKVNLCYNGTTWIP